ncbi:testis expressed gene 11, isoform CRA_a [Mus musculus]|nr:testis expressed gene 11, isoform CRA_a [Mus musculus]
MDRITDFYFLDFRESVKTLIITGNSWRLQEMIDRFFTNISNFNRESLTEIQNIQIEEIAVNLWNWAVTKRVELSVRKNQAAKLCYIACKLVYMHGISVSSEEAIQRQILMNIKTGKEWLYTGNAQIADEFFQAAMTDLERLYVRLMQSCYTEANVCVYKMIVEKGIFHVLSYQAESAVAQGDFKKASMCVLRCKDMLMRLPNMTKYLHVLCYNLGIEASKRNKYKESSFWLGQSYEIGKMDRRSVEPQMLAKTLRLLATIYLNCGGEAYYTKAFIAILIANKEHLHPAGLFLKMRILMKGNSCNEELLEAAKEILYLAMPLEFYLSIIQFLIDNKRESVGFRFLRIISDNFKSPEDRKRILLFYIDTLLQKDQDMIAEEKIKDVLKGYQTRSRLSRDLVNWLHNILWGKASRSVKVQKYADALHWYSYSLKLYEYDKADLDLIKLKRNMVSCYLSLKQLDKALQVVSALKKSLMDGESEDRGLIEAGVSTLTILSLSIDFALENGQQFVAERALEYLCQLSKDPKEVLGGLKCLMRIILPQAFHMPESEYKKKEMGRLWNYLNTALLKFSEYFNEAPSTLDYMVNDANWFRKIAWNLAVQSEKDLEAMKNFFMVISYQLSLFCPLDQGLLIAQKTCLLVAAAVDLDRGRKAPTICEQNMLLRTALEQIKKWDFSGDDCGVLLLLYEFEVKTKTNDPSLSRFVDSVWKMPDLECRTLETMALLAMDKPAYYPTIAHKAMKKLLLMYRKQEPVDVLKYSVCMHNLIKLLVADEVWNISLYPLKEVQSHFKNTLSIIRQNEGYPEEEIVWLMIKSWNIGILMSSKNKYISAERWAAMALDFLGHLSTLKTSYEAKVNLLYANLMEILDKKTDLRSTEMTEQLRALIVPPEDQGSVSSTNVAAQNHL